MVNDDTEPGTATPVYTWRTFLLFWSAAIVVAAVLGVVLAFWLPQKTAMSAGIGASIPLAFSGNRRWREPQILAYAVCLMSMTGVVGALIARWLP